MPVTNARLGQKMAWTEPGRSGMPIKPTGRPCGTLANLAGIAENVGRLTEEERALRERPAPLLVMTSTPPHVAEIDESHYQADSSPSSLAFRALDAAVGAAVGVVGVVRRAARGRSGRE